MTKGKTTPFRGSRFLIQTGIAESGEAVTDITTTNPATVTVGSSTVIVRGDVITLTGLGDLDGEYVVATAVAGVLTLADTDWSDYTAPEEFTGATAAKHLFSNNFCELTSMNKAGSTIAQDDVSTICSDDFNDYESGAADAGTLQLGFNAAPAQSIQGQLRTYERSREKFWVKVILTRGQGSFLYYGAIQTGPGLEGSSGSANFTSGVTIQLSGNYYFIPAV